jgi:zinc and cadmium transporter
MDKKTDIKTSLHQIVLIIAGVLVIGTLHGVAHDIEIEQHHETSASL